MDSADADTVAPQAATEDTPAAPASEEATPHSEAARHRIRAREAEAARDEVQGRLDAATARVAAMEAAVVARVAGAVLDRPGDFWSLGPITPDEIPRDESGNVDEAALAGLVATFAAERPGLTKEGAKRARVRLGPSASGQGQRGRSMPQPTTWSDVLRRGR